MYQSVIQKLISVLLSIAAFFSLAGGARWGDTMAGHNVPLIAAEEKTEGCVRVVSFNVRCDDNNGVPMISRKNLVVRALTELRPDSFGLQEATPEWMTTLKAMFPELHRKVQTAPGCKRE